MTCCYSYWRCSLLSYFGAEGRFSIFLVSYFEARGLILLVLNTYIFDSTKSSSKSSTSILRTYLYF